METGKSIIDLWHLYLNNRATSAEAKELFTYILESEDNNENIVLLQQALLESPGKITMDAGTQNSMLQEIMSLEKKNEIPGSIAISPVHRVQFFRSAWFRYAAILLLITGISAYIFQLSKSKRETAGAQLTKKSAIKPGGNNAVLTLSDGSTIVLNNTTEGSLARQGTTTIVKLNDGALAYTAGTAPSLRGDKILYNTISTPRGGQYQLVLQDGTKVWLNAASSVRYPVAFINGNRKIEITGEAYFEVAKDLNKPFFVTHGQLEVQVLGTHFNMNTYDDEESSKVTLLEGSVKVATGLVGAKSAVIVPGQQAQVKGAQLKVIDDADLERTVAWKNGLFNFEDATLEEVMRQITRWYNIKVRYEKGIPHLQFWGKMSRATTLPGLLKNLEDVGVHYRIVEEKRELIILP